MANLAAADATRLNADLDRLLKQENALRAAGKVQLADFYKRARRELLLAAPLVNTIGVTN